MQDLPLTGPLADLERIDSTGHYIARLTERLARPTRGGCRRPPAADTLALLRRWRARYGRLQIEGAQRRPAAINAGLQHTTR